MICESNLTVSRLYQVALLGQDECLVALSSFSFK